MPTYVFDENSFLDFIKKNVKGNIAVVSSDVLDVNVEEIETHLGVKKHFVVKFAISADVFKDVDLDSFDELLNYAVVFVERDKLSEERKKAIR
ncbi:AF2331 family protein [Archaeoglobus sp.]